MEKLVWKVEEGDVTAKEKRGEGDGTSRFSLPFATPDPKGRLFLCPSYEHSPATASISYPLF